MENAIKDIPSLLHDALLTDCRWDYHLRTLVLCFQCLRRHVDGTPIEDSAVDLRLTGVEKVTACCSPASIFVKPSDFKPDHRISLADLEVWPNGAVEAHLAINSLQSEFEAETSCVRETLFGKPDDHDEPPLRIQVSFEPHNYGPEATSSSLLVDCDSIEPFSNGLPLDIETWQRQFEAWWTGWKEHWSAKGEDDPEEGDSTLEDTFIPAGQPDPPDLSYRPPSVAAFLLSSATAPLELLKPVNDYHTSLHEGEWLKVAAAYPNFDHTPVERAAQLRDQFQDHDFGRWAYIRHIDSWWCEGNRACLVVRGIEHVLGDNESPTSNEETVITYALRKFRQKWVIATWSQGWPRFGSAEKLQEPQTWREGWNLAE